VDVLEFYIVVVMFFATKKSDLLRTHAIKFAFIRLYSWVFTVGMT
jgi:hypothetical protein